MIAIPGPPLADEWEVAVLAEPRKYAGALELAISLSTTGGGELVILASRPRLLRGALHLAGYDPDELADHAAAAMKDEIHCLVDELAPGLPHLIVEVGDPNFRRLLRLAEAHRCSILVVPRRAGGWARLSRRLVARSSDLEVVVAP
jgi:nucleotide-binding universal stress UspA family protein